MEKKKKSAPLPVDPEQQLPQEVTPLVTEETTDEQTDNIAGDAEAVTADVETETTTEKIPEIVEPEAVIEPIIEAEPVVAESIETVAEPDLAEPTGEVVTESKVQAETTEETVVDTPVAEEVAEPVAEEVAEPVAEEVAEPVAKEVAEPVAEEVAEPVAKEVAEPVTEEVSEEVAEPVAENVVELVAEAVIPEAEEKAEAAQMELTPVIEEIPEAEEVHKTEEEEAEEEAVSVAPVAVEDYSVLDRPSLLEKLDSLVHEDDITTIKTQVALIKVTFLKLSKEEKHRKLEEFVASGGIREEYVQEEDELDTQFHETFNIYKNKKQKLDEEFEHQKLKNLEEKKHILEELKVLINSEETLKKTYDEFRALQDTWNQIGMVPKPDATELWQNYHFLVEKFFDKVKINKELKDLDLKKNLESKIAICEKAEALLLEPSIIKSFKYLQQYHEEWKEIGPVAQDKKDEIWNRFKDATDKINERRRDYYSEIKEEQESNLMAKNALIDQAEKVVGMETVTTKQWQETTDQLNELQKIWRTIGPAPKAKNDEVWQKFKSLIDGYFTNKKEFFNDIKEEQVHNYNKKLDLCVQAEALKDNTDWKKTTQELIHLQDEWKKIGPVPRKYSDKVWKRFRTACDEFFTQKAKFFSNIHASEAENLKKKEELIRKVTEYEFTEDKKQNLDIINGFQREWMEIGFVPIKEKERLQTEFRKAINQQLDKLKISAQEMSTMAFKNRYDNLVKESPDAIRIIAREKTTLQQKIAKIQEEINLWENNIGFLAESKKANLLKEEFEKKINKAKEEMKLMEVKLKLLRES